MNYGRSCRRLLTAASIVFAFWGGIAPTYGLSPGAAYRQTASSIEIAYTPNYAANLKNLLHWARFPVRIAFTNPSGDPARKMDGIVVAGFDAWVRETAGCVRYVIVSDPKKADITVTYQQIAAEPAWGGELGVTNYTYNPKTLELWSADIHLNVWPHMTRSDLAKLQNTATHEFGHALGIDGHSPDADDIMYYMTSAESSLSIRDINTLKIAYHGFTRADATAVGITP